MRRAERAAGFTLVEVIVALTILEVGMLAAAGTLLLAQITLRDAWLIERAAGDAAAVADSLLATRATASGQARRAGYRLLWERDEAGWIVRADAAGRPLIEVSAPWAR